MTQDKQWTREDSFELISDAISDSLDVDWNGGTGAQSVLAALEANGLTVAPVAPSPAVAGLVGAGRAVVEAHWDAQAMGPFVRKLVAALAAYDKEQG